MFKRILLSLAISSLVMSEAGASIISLPHPIVAGQLAKASDVQGDFTTIYNDYNGNITYANIGSAGIYASQIIPTNGTQATFGGSQTYTFPAGIAVTQGVSSGNTIIANGSTDWLHAYSSGCGNIYWNSSSSNTAAGIMPTGFGAFCSGSSTPLFNVDSSGDVGVNGTLNSNGAITGASLAAGGSATVGSLTTGSMVSTGSSIFSGSSGILVNNNGNFGSVTSSGSIQGASFQDTALSSAGVVTNNASGVLSSVTPGGSGNLLTSNGSAWVSVARSVSFPAYGTSGYVTLPSGFIIQWGVTSSFGGSGTASVSYPITFPHALFNVTSTVTTTNTVNAVQTCTPYGQSLTNMSIYFYQTGSGPFYSPQCTWMAMGY